LYVHNYNYISPVLFNQLHQYLTNTCGTESLRKIFKPPKTMLKLYSLFILTLDLVILLVRIFFAIIIALYRIFRPPPLKNLNYEVAMVVGAGQGIGREMAIHLCKLRVKVACIDINSESCSTTVNLAQQASVGIARMYICNITDKDEVALTVDRIRLELGEITMFFHCCSIPSAKVLNQEDELEIRYTIDLTILSYFWNRIPLSAAQFAVQGLAKSLSTEFRQSNYNIIVTLVHIYPFILGTEAYSDIRFRIPSYFGTITAKKAAKQILDGVRRNYLEFSVPGYIFYLSNISRILPKEVSFIVNELLDTGIDFG
ncbi:Epidermal retinol dehydrogenase 2, partial [Melipona quadrifasciata]